MSLLYFKLSNGDDIMADMIEEHEDHFLIKWPYKFLYQVNPFNNVLATSVIRWAPMKEVMVEPMKILKGAIVTYAEMPEILENYYIRIKERTMEEFDEEGEITDRIVESDHQVQAQRLNKRLEEMNEEFEEEMEQLGVADTKDRTIH
jgi:hypothetical protein